jgi:hypothetical protein
MLGERITPLADQDAFDPRDVGRERALRRSKFSALRVDAYVGLTSNPKKVHILSHEIQTPAITTPGR